jgi:hypothetical protein
LLHLASINAERPQRGFDGRNKSMEQKNRFAKTSIHVMANRFFYDRARFSSVYAQLLYLDSTGGRPDIISSRPNFSLYLYVEKRKILLNLMAGIIV